jgi:hypothetical protein
VGQARIVDQDRQRLLRTQPCDGVDAVGRGEVGSDDLDRNGRRHRRREILEPVGATGDHDQVVAIVGQPAGKGSSDSRGSAGDEGE